MLAYQNHLSSKFPCNLLTFNVILQAKVVTASHLPPSSKANRVKLLPFQLTQPGHLMDTALGGWRGPSGSGLALIRYPQSFSQGSTGST